MMIKTFTLKAIDHEQATPQSGLITWHLVDENNHKRVVKAITELSRLGFIKTIRPRHDREMPLVEVLSYHVEGESFQVDFSNFNATHGYKPREVFPSTQQPTQLNAKLRDSLRELFHPHCEG